jgi:hypothetical protein
MSWIGQIALGAYLVFFLGTVAALFASILLATCEFPSPGNNGFSSQALPDRKTTGTRPE